MKKYFLILAAFTMMAASCQKEQKASEEGKVVKVSLSAKVDNKGTKVDYVKDGSVFKGSWSEGDELCLIAPNNANACLTYVGDNKFEGEVVAWTTESDVYGIYPYKAYTITDGVLKDYNASKVTVEAGETDCSGCLMVAEGRGTSAEMPTLTFAQTSAVIRIKITGVPAGTTVSKVSIINQDMYSNRTLVGKADIDMETGAISGTPTYTSIVEADIANAEAGAVTYVNLPVLPTATAAKYTFAVKLSNDDCYVKTLADARTFAQNTIYTMNFALSDSNKNDLLLMVNYNLDNTAVDISGYGRTMYGAVDAQANSSFGIINKSTYQDDYVSPMTTKVVYCENLYNEMDKGYTIEIWAYPTIIPSGSGEAKIFSSTSSCGSNLLIYQQCYTWAQNDGSWRIIKGPAAVANKWAHLVAIWDGTQLIFYIDKATDPLSLSGVNTLNKSYVASLPFTGIGCNIRLNENASNSFGGYMGATKIWNRALSVAEVEQLFAAAPSDPENP